MELCFAGLTVGETVSLLSFLVLVVGIAIQVNVRMKGNEDEIKALKESTDANIKALMETTNIRITVLETGRVENSNKIEGMRKENKEDHELIMTKIDALMNELISILRTGKEETRKTRKT